MLWFVDSAAALECNGYGLESFLVGLFEKGSVHLKGQTQYMNVHGNVYLGVSVANFFNSLKLTNQKQPKVTYLIGH